MNELNIGLTGKIESDTQWDYYELKSESVACGAQLQCRNRKCLKREQICDGKYDCGSQDATDETGCPSQPNIKIRFCCNLSKIVAFFNFFDLQAKITTYSLMIILKEVRNDMAFLNAE